MTEIKPSPLAPTPSPPGPQATSMRPPSAGWVALMLLVWLSAFAWARPLLIPDEGRYVGVAWEMVRSGDWLTPTQNGLPFFHKPPLFYWLTAASLSAWGVHEWSARLAPIVGTWATGLMLFWFVRRWWHAEAALKAVMAFACLPMVMLGGQFANLDMLVASCIAITLMLLAHHVWSADQGVPAPWALWAAYGVAALGVLAKGLIGLVLPGLVVLSWLVLTRRWRRILPLFSLPGALVFLAVAAPWFLAMQAQHADFLHYFFIVQHFQRYAGTGFNNAQPFWFYGAVLALSTLPLLPYVLRTLSASWRADHQRRDLRVFAWVWLLAITLFFSFPISKPLGYILPVMVPLALLAVDGWWGCSPDTALPVDGGTPKARARWWWAVGVCAGLSLITVAWYALKSPRTYAPLAQVLKLERQGNEPVVMLHNYLFDVPMLVGLRTPLVVIDNWHSEDVKRHDNWRKELAEAARFRPGVAATTLLLPSQLPAVLCAAPVTWILGSDAMPSTYGALAQATTRAQHWGHQLWRFDREAALLAGPFACPAVQSAG